MTDNRIEVRVSAASVGKFLAVVTALVVAVHIFFQLIKYTTGHDHIYGVTPFFDLWGEQNFPAWYSTVLLALAGLVSLMAGLHHRVLRSKDQYYWLVLAFVFAFLSLDEAVSIHERLIVPIRSALNTSGFLSLAWIIPYGIGVLALGIVYLRFWMRLPYRTRLFVFIAGAIFLSGALGVESISGYLYELDERTRTFRMDVVNLIEESMEMSGIVLFVYTVLRYVAVELHASRQDAVVSKNAGPTAAFTMHS